MHELTKEQKLQYLRHQGYQIYDQDIHVEFKDGNNRHISTGIVTIAWKGLDVMSYEEAFSKEITENMLLHSWFYKMNCDEKEVGKTA